MSALGTNLSDLWAGLRARTARFSGSPPSVADDAPALNGGCIRGFLWALLFEGASLAVLAGLVFGVYRLSH